MITVTITGNLADDPRTFRVRDGQEGCDLRVAVDLPPRGADGDSPVRYLKVVAFIRWSADTRQRSLDLVTGQARDAVTTFLDTGYVQEKIIQITRTAAAPVRDPQEAIRVIGQRLRFTEDQQNTILAHFIRGADTTVGGILHAVTSTAQTLEDADAAHDMEARAIPAMDIAART
jgi:hypothetical protein